MAHKKEIFTQNQVASKLGIQAYMVGAWEKTFNIQATLQNGEKTYTHKDLATFRSIKELLYEKGLSMDAAKKYLSDGSDLEGSSLPASSHLLFTAAKAAKITPSMSPSEKEKDIAKKLLTIKERLISLRNSLSS